LKIYITRHGETEWNKLGKMQGWKNSNLTPNGISNAIKLGNRLKDIDFDLVCCSPLGRAVETASHVLKDRNIEITYDEAFREMSFGVWEGMPHEDVKSLYPVQHHNYWNEPHLYEAVDGESYEAFISRVRQGFEKIINRNDLNNVLIVTHAAVVKAIFTIVYNRSVKDFWAPPFVYDTCLSVLEVVDGEIRVLMENDISHLD
jgi:broad specificity phosphatase PhoE